jgi:hypothetical protein
MRSLFLYCTLMTDVRSIIGSVGPRHSLTCTFYEQIEEPASGFAGSE